MLAEAGEPDQAAAQYRDLLDDYLRILGPSSTPAPSSAAATSPAAWARGLGTRPGRQPLRRPPRRLPTDHGQPDHPHTLTTRGHLAYWLGQAGATRPGNQPLPATSSTTDYECWDPTTPTPSSPAPTSPGCWPKPDNPTRQPATTATSSTTSYSVLEPHHPSTLITRGHIAEVAGHGRATRPSSQPVPRPPRRLPAGAGTRPPRHP